MPELSTTVSSSRRPFISRKCQLFVGLLMVSVLATTMYQGLSPSAIESIEESEEEEMPEEEVFEADEDILTPEEVTQIDEELPHAAWILTYGGTDSYTILNIEHTSTYTTASNYAADYDPLVPVHDSWKEGPFIRSPDKGLPPNYIATNTHCGGYCMDCPPSAYVMTPEEFERSCLTGQIKVDGERRSVTYNKEIPQKAVHIFHNPFDNLVSRLHMSIKKRLDRGESAETWANQTDDMEGLGAWCHEMSEHHTEAEIDSELLPDNFYNDYSHIPCHAEWFRYIQWHNLAYEVVVNRLQIPVHFMHNDDYEDDYNATVDALFEFLELPKNAPPQDLIATEHYGDFFHLGYAVAVGEMIKDLASEPVWELVKSFFTPFEEQAAAAEAEAAANPPDEEAEDPDEDIFEDPNPLIPNATSSDPPEVAWLLSFPNSGTSYTILNTEQLSELSTASNYAHGWDLILPVTAESPEGPFVHKPNMGLPGPDQHVLTKTHCGGYCDDCSSDHYVLSVDEFETWCRSGNMDLDGTQVTTTYAATVPSKVVHLIRDPVDNLVSRLHLAVKRRAKMGWTEEQLSLYESSAAGMRSWCLDVTDKNAEREANQDLWTSPELEQFVTSFPCHADLYRYVQWHNRAIQVTKKLDLPVHYLYYEKYTTQYSETVRDLFDFLGLEQSGTAYPFEAGKSYADFISEEEGQAATQLARAVATDECWDLIKHYFEPWIHALDSP